MNFNFEKVHIKLSFSQDSTLILNSNSSYYLILTLKKLKLEIYAADIPTD